MSQELIYTSATKGLKPGSRGFCTVACTSGMAKNLADLLESFSGYKHLFAPEGPDAKRNPVNHAFYRFKLGGVENFVVSRVADCGLDYTQRTNKIAHHFVMGREELSTVGPAGMMQQASLFVKQWEDTPRLLTPRRLLEPEPLRPTPCLAWKAITGDAGWGGEFVASVAGDTLRKAYLIYKPGTDVLALFAESMALLHETRRWSVSFSTYFTTVPPGVDCHWRGLVDGTSDAERARHMRDELVIDLTNLSGQPSESEFVEMARTGRATTPVQEQAHSPSEATSSEPAIHPDPREVLETPREFSTRPTSPAQLPPKLPQHSVSDSVPYSSRTHQEDVAQPRSKLLILAAVFAIASMIAGIGLGALFFGSPANNSSNEGIAQANGEQPDTTTPEIDGPDYSLGEGNGNSVMQFEAELLEALPIHDGSSGDAAISDAPLTDHLPEKVTNPGLPDPKIDIKQSEVNNQSSERDQSPPSGLFDDLADSISLPEKVLSGNKDNNVKPVSIGKLNPERFTVVLQLMQSGKDLKVERVHESPPYWKITTEDRQGLPIALAIVRCAGGKATIRWSENFAGLAERTLRSSFLVFSEAITGQKKVVALESPVFHKETLYFLDDIREVGDEVDEEDGSLGSPNLAFPKGQFLYATGNVVSLPFVNDNLEVSLRDYPLKISGNSEELEGRSWDIVQGGSLRLIMQIGHEPSPYLKAKIQYVENFDRNKHTDYNTKSLSIHITKRSTCVEEEIDKHLAIHWKNGTVLLADYFENREGKTQKDMPENLKKLHALSIEKDSVRFKEAVWHNFIAAVQIPQPSLGEPKYRYERERYEEWLRTKAWKLSKEDWNSLARAMKDHDLDITKYFFTEGGIKIKGKLIKINGKLEGFQKKLPIERLLAWEKGVGEIQKTKIHFRLSRSLAKSDASGIDPPPHADVLVVGNPSDPMND